MQDTGKAIASLKYLRQAVPTIGDLRIGGLDRPLSTAEQIADRIAEDLISGEILPGEWLRETLLAKRFDVSRGPIREAIQILEADGMIQFHRNRGARVPILSGRDLWQIRLISEALAVPINKVLCDRLTDQMKDEFVLTAAYVRDHATATTPTARSPT